MGVEGGLCEDRTALSCPLKGSQLGQSIQVCPYGVQLSRRQSVRCVYRTLGIRS
jgi:hypothetical protein